VRSADTKLVLLKGSWGVRLYVRGAVTFSTTTDKDGTAMEDEEAVLKYVDRQLAAKANPSKYVRSLGACLVSKKYNRLF